jgi:hypothetical protein
VTRQDWRDVDTGRRVDGVGIYDPMNLRHRANTTETICEVLAVFGLADLVAAGRAQQVITDPGAAAISPLLADRLQLDLGIRWDEKRGKPLRLLSTVLRRLGLKLKSKQIRVGTARTAEYRIDLQVLDQALADSQHYYEKLAPPPSFSWSGVREIDLVGGILADVGPFPPLPRAA